MAWHEFGHSFSNPVVSRNREGWEPYSNLFEPIARIMRRTLSDAAAEAALRKKENAGFQYIPALYDRLGEYEAARDRYPTIDDFGHRLMSVFREIAQGGASE